MGAPLLLLFLWMVGAGLVSASEPEGPSSVGLVERVGVELVELEVRVVDRQGRPAHGLTREDFELRLNGTPRQLTHCSEFDAVRASAMPPSASDGRSALPEPESPFLVIFVDQWNLHPASRRWAFDGLRRMLLKTGRPPFRTLVASFDGEVRIVQPFTIDTRRVVDALYDLERLASGRQADEAERQRLLEELSRGVDPSSTIESVETYAESIAHRTRTSLVALRSFIDTLAGLEGGTHLLHVSDGLPRSPGEDLFLALDERFRSGFGRMRALRHDLSASWEELTQTANASRVTLHALHAHNSNVDALSAEHGGWAGQGNQLVDATHELDLRTSLEEFASATGGQGLAGRADLDDWLARVAADLGAHYSLAFEAPPAGADPQRVEVHTQRPGLRVRHRRALRVKSPAERLADATRSTLHFGMGRNPLSCSMEFEPTVTRTDSALVPMLVRIPIERLTLVPRSGERVAQVRIAIGVLDELGRTTPPVLQAPFDVHVPESDLPRALRSHYTYTVELELRSGRQRVVVAVRDELSGLTSVLDEDVQVGE